MRHRFRRKPDLAVSAVRLALDFEGFTYKKWGDTQRAAAGDWLVDNNGRIHGASGLDSPALYGLASQRQQFR